MTIQDVVLMPGLHIPPNANELGLSERQVQWWAFKIWFRYFGGVKIRWKRPSLESERMHSNFVVRRFIAGSRIYYSFSDEYPRAKKECRHPKPYYF